MHLCLYEDSQVGHFHPLTYFRPVYDLRCGILTLREKFQHLFRPSALAVYARPFLTDLLREENPQVAVNVLTGTHCLMINGRMLLSSAAARSMSRQRTDALFVSGDDTAGAVVSGSILQAFAGSLARGEPNLQLLESLPRIEVEAAPLRYLWDLVVASGTEIVSDFRLLRPTISRTAVIHKSAILAGRRNIGIGSGSEIGPGAILDARKGPVYVGKNVTVSAGAVLEGPCAVGDGSIVRIHARIGAGTSVGPFCKVGGEVQRSIFQSYANKAHDGFLGDSFIGSWVNLGAGTTSSNLKNTYGTVRVSVNGTTVDTGRMYVGTFAGDHVKAGINSAFTTGTVIGPAANLYGGGSPPKFVPAFSWGGAGRLEPYLLEKALKTAVIVMGRRDVAASDAYKTLFRHVHAMTAHEREHIGR
ncbi:MAG: putative sugar nucleotidyl transferase [Bacteroidota bacterium]